jgi:formyl-CoA transferase
MAFPDPDSAEHGPQEGPLAGLRVVEVSIYIQGPVAGLTLASLGADVVKIERVGAADQMRSLGGQFGVVLDERGRAWQYASLNRGKRSLALDVASPRGVEVFRHLIERADVFLTNLRSDALERIGADFDSLRSMNPLLVYAQGAGFGLRGPLAQDPCQDTLGMAYSGFMDVSSPDERPHYPPGSMSDVLTGTNLASAVMAGLLRRSVSGRGGLVGTSQVQSLLWLTNQAVCIASSIGETMKRFSIDQPPNALMTPYETADGWVAVAVIHPDQWPALASAIGLDELLDDARFTRFGHALKNTDALLPILQERFRERTTDEWWRVLRDAGVWAGPVNRVQDLAQDPHVLANEYLVTFPDGFVGPPAPYEVDGWRGSRGVAAEYGEHTDEVLRELGYDDDDLLELRVRSAIW